MFGDYGKRQNDTNYVFLSDLNNIPISWADRRKDKYTSITFVF